MLPLGFTSWRVPFKTRRHSLSHGRDSRPKMFPQRADDSSKRRVTNEIKSDPQSESATLAEMPHSDQQDFRYLEMKKFWLACRDVVFHQEQQ